MALREIKHYQRTTQLLLLRLPFARLVREVATVVSRHDHRWQAEAIEALQEASESYLIGLLEDAYAHHVSTPTFLSFSHVSSRCTCNNVSFLRQLTQTVQARKDG